MKLETARLRIKQMKSIIGIGKNWIMKDYVSKKECKKLNFVKELK